MTRLSASLVKKALNLELPLRSLAAIRLLKEEIAELEWEAIVEARAKGASMNEIAAEIGITRQALQQRLGRNNHS